MYKLSSNMMVNQTPDSFLGNACCELQQVVGLRWMVLQIADQQDNLCVLAGQIFTAGELPTGKRALKQIGLQLIQEVGTSSEPVVLDDLSRMNIPGLPDLAHHLLVVPLVREGVPFGLIFGADKLDDSHISSIDSKLCSSLASTMSIFLQNAMLYEDMQSMFLGTLHALTSSIDAKDSYTHGHSERVALMSRRLAEAAGLDDLTCERIYVAGLVHDVGKIGVPESVLCKPGRLTFEEFELIKQHPEIGARILQDIRQMHDLIPGVLYHHERWDGNGYPHRLTARDIPLFGRVIGLADAFDAMSTNRTYRRALKHEDVMAEIERCAGSQFDPDLAKVFMKLNFDPFFEMVQKHQAAFEEEATSESDQ
jgi:HD-GYP domain-containing protein (c-di-GMP phosphodiesterase class II)